MVLKTIEDCLYDYDTAVLGTAISSPIVAASVTFSPLLTTALIGLVGYKIINRAKDLHDSIELQRRFKKEAVAHERQND